MNRDIMLGYTADGARVTVQIKLGPYDGARTVMSTVHHIEVAAADVVRLSITGEVWDSRYGRGDNAIVQAGQCTEVLLDIIQPAPGWTRAEIRELHDIWERWHLNDMRAGCAHQTRIVWESGQHGRRVDLDATTKANDCPANYRYGSAWLYEPLPTEVVERIHIFQRRLRP